MLQMNVLASKNTLYLLFDVTVLSTLLNIEKKI